MTVLDRQRLLFRDRFRSVHREEFASWFAELARAMHPTGDFQPVRLTQGDDGIDGFSIAGQIVYQVFAPPRMDETRDGETADKIARDFASAYSALQREMRGWVFVHNHPEGKLGKLGIAAINQLQASHTGIRIEVWNIDTLWDRVAELPTPAREVLFPSRETPRGTGDAVDGTELIRDSLVTRGADFAVPALDLRLPVSEAWDRLRWLPASEPSATGLASLDGEIQRYYEWARLARTDVFSDFLAAGILGSGRRTIIVGGPGSGKSTLARKLAWLAASRGNSVWRVSLRAVARLIERDRSFVEAMQVSALQEAAIPATAEAGYSPPMVLIADGLDEADPNRLAVAGALRDWALANPNATLVITTRPVGHTPGILPEFSNAELMPLTEKAIGQFARTMLKGCKAPSEGAEQFLALVLPPTLWGRKNRSAATIASRSPLLLSFLLALHLDGQSIGMRRPELYAAILDLSRRGSGHDRLVRSNLPTPILHLGLDALAWAALNNPGMERNAQLAVVATAVGSQTPAEWHADEITAFWIERKVLEIIRLGQREALVFVHPTLAEFCAARHLQRIGPVAGKAWLTMRRRSAAARETILLACGCGEADWIVPELLALDTDDVRSTEAILAATALGECKTVPAETMLAASRQIAHKLVSAVPLISVEAAESLRAVASIAGPVLHEACRTLYHHAQPWTCLGARVLGLASHDPALPASEVGGWLVPAKEAETGSTGWSNWPDGSVALHAHLVDLGFEKLFVELPLAEARKLAEEFLAAGHYSVLEAERLDEVFSRHGCEDLLAKRHERWMKLMADFPPTEMEAAADRQIESLLALIFAATGFARTAGDPPPGFVAETLGDFLDSFGFWEMPISVFWGLDDTENREVAVETMRGAIAASGVSVAILAADTNVLLAIDQKLQKKLFEVVTKGKGAQTDWSRAKAVGLEGDKLVSALLHPSDLIKVVAANLLGAGAGGIISSDLAWEVLCKSHDDGLYYVAGIAPALWPETKTKVLLRRLEFEPRDGLEHVCRELGKQAAGDEQAEVQERLLAIVLKENATLATGAAEGLGAMGMAALPSYADRLREVLSHWTNAKIKCEKCGTEIQKGSCPGCSVIPTTPHGGLVRGLTAIDGILEPELIALCRSKWYSAKQAAVEIMSKRAGADCACLKRILSEPANAPSELLESVLKLPKPVLAEAIDEMVGLRHSARPEIRLIFMQALPSLPVPEERKEAIAREALTDLHPPVRDAATKVLRV